MKVHIGKEIAKVQKIRGMSNDDFADSIHTSVRNISKIKTKDDLFVSQLYNISEALNYNFFQLFDPAVVEPKNILADHIKEFAKSEKKMTVRIEVQYPVSEASELGKFMMKVHAIADKMGFEIA